nr:micos complex subunit mic10 [Quercus suber]
MADSRSANAPVVPSPTRPGRPLSEALLNEKWDHCLSTLLIRSTLGASFGVIFSVLLFKRRAFPVWAGLGFGAGRAWEECDSSFKRATVPSRDGLRTLRS